MTRQEEFEKWVVDNHVWIEGYEGESAMLRQCYEFGYQQGLAAGGTDAMDK